MPASSHEAMRTSPAALRNRGPILDVLRRVLPARGDVLEIASGSGEHAASFAGELPDLTWQPTDREPDALASIAAYCDAAGLLNLRPPLVLDVRSPVWPVTRTDALIAINMIHIAPWAAAEGLMAGARRVLAPGGILYLYGPFKEAGRHTAPSNAAFDAELRRCDPAWGVRELDDVVELGRNHGVDFVERVAMPANNLSLVFRRRAPDG